MRIMTGNSLLLSLSTRLNRRPVLTALVVYSIGLGVAASIGAFAVWRASTSCPMLRRSQNHYVVQSSADVAGRRGPLSMTVYEVS